MLLRCILITGLLAQSMSWAKPSDQFIREHFGLPNSVPIRPGEDFSIGKTIANECSALSCSSFLSILNLSDQIDKILVKNFEAVLAASKRTQEVIREQLLMRSKYPAIDPYNEWLDTIEKDNQLLNRSANFDCGGYSLLTTLKCEVQANDRLLDDLSVFTNVCKKLQPCFTDVRNSLQIRKEIPTRFWNFLQKARMLANYDDDIIPSLAKQLAKANNNFEPDMISKCLKASEQLFFSNDMKHLNTPSQCSGFTTTSSSFVKTERWQKIAEMMKRIKTERAIIGDTYTQKNCFIPGTYACSSRVVCIRDYLNEIGIKDSWVIHSQAGVTFFDSKRNNADIRKSLIFSGVEYEFHAAVIVEIDGAPYVLDHLVADEPVPLNQWLNKFAKPEDVEFLVNQKIWNAPKLFGSMMDKEILKKENIGKMICDMSEKKINPQMFWSLSPPNK